MEEVAFTILDAEETVQQFVIRRQTGLRSLHRMYVKDASQLSFSALIEELKPELQNGVISYYNQHSDVEGIDSYLFYIANSLCKKRVAQEIPSHSEYICPGCLFLGMATPVFAFDRHSVKCEECWAQLKIATDPKQVAFYRTFSVHHKSGYRCPDCHRFIPFPVENVSLVACPYFDCCFVGEQSTLGKMHHPNSRTNPEKLVLDVMGETSVLKNRLIAPTTDALAALQQQEDLLHKKQLLQEVIDSQSHLLAYSSTDFTVKHKQLVYQAFANLLEIYPQEMVDYLLNRSRTGGFQHKVFQEYVALLEESLPFFIRKGRKQYLIDNLLHEQMCIFHGLSIFHSTITDKMQIKNGTQEFYIGSRKGAYAQPYYIGKLLNVVDANTQEPLLHLVKEYTFSRISLQEVQPGTPVIVSHLRIPPHYQMGGMVYVNRIRKKIIERSQSLLQQEKDA